MELLSDIHTPAAEAICHYFEYWSPDAARQCTDIEDNWSDLMAGVNLLFYYAGEAVTEDPACLLYTYLRELVAQMPNENYIFFGDSKNAPYGTKTLEEVQKLTCADAEYLLSRGVKALVVACNTATSAAIRILREKYADMPVIGIEPALKPAVHAGGHPRVLVMATPMTLREEKFHALMQRFESDAEILRLPCPGPVSYTHL